VVTDRIHINDDPIDTALKWLNHEINPTKTNYSDTWWSKTRTSIRTLNSKFHIKITFYRELEEIKLRVVTRIEDGDDERIKTCFDSGDTIVRYHYIFISFFQNFLLSDAR